jgi:hypothetical protein
MIVDKVWKLTNTVRVGLDDRSSHAQRQSTFPDNVCSYCPPCHGVSHYENLTTFLFFEKKITLEVLLKLPHHIPWSTLSTIKLVGERSVLIRSC